MASTMNISEGVTPTAIDDYTVDSQSTDSVSAEGKTRYNNENFQKYYGKYRKVAKIKRAIDAYATWLLGLGWTADNTTTAMLESITGAGEDTFNSVLWNQIVISLVNGDSYAERIIDEDTGIFINLKPLDPASMTTVWDDKGMIEGYEKRNGTDVQEFPTHKILHIMHDRVADETHGTSAIESIEWNVEAQEEAKRVHRKMIWRNGIIRVIYVNTQDAAKIANFKKIWKEGIDTGDVLILPKGTAEVGDWKGTLDTQGIIAWLNYLDDEFYVAIGIPRPIAGGSGDLSEGNSKVLYLTFEPTYRRGTIELEADLWNQLAIRIKFNKPASLSSDMQQNEAKNTSQTGFQPKDTTVTGGNE